jgi:tetratricopeptide (TPR) repeat protein
MREAEELIVWGAPAPSEEHRRLRREAADEVDKLLDTLGLKEEILDHLRTLASLSEPVREHALTIAERLPEEPWRLNRAGYQVVQQTGLVVARYQRALRQAEAAQRLGPPEYPFYSPFYHPAAVAGFAHYRLGQYRECVETLLRAEALYKEQDPRGSGPRILGFLAMAYDQLGQKEEARDTLAQLREVLKDPFWSRQGDHQIYLREAAALIEGKAPDLPK